MLLHHTYMHRYYPIPALRPNFGAEVRTMREYVQFLQGCGYLGLLKYR